MKELLILTLVQALLAAPIIVGVDIGEDTIKIRYEQREMIAERIVDSAWTDYYIARNGKIVKGKTAPATVVKEQKRRIEWNGSKKLKPSLRHSIELH